MYAFGADTYFNLASTRHKSRLHQVGTKMLPGISYRYALNSGARWTGDLIIADWYNIENNVASEVLHKKFQVQRSRINQLQEVFYFPCADGFPKTRRVTHTVKPYATKESKASTRGEYPQVCDRDGVTLGKKKVELRIFLKLIATPGR